MTGQCDSQQAVFFAAHRDADTMLVRDGDPDAFFAWALGTIRRQGDRYLRYAALDGIMAAMDDDEARRG